jgi:hypothetical protein
MLKKFPAADFLEIKKNSGKRIENPGRRRELPFMEMMAKVVALADWTNVIAGLT